MGGPPFALNGIFVAFSSPRDMLVMGLLMLTKDVVTLDAVSNPSLPKSHNNSSPTHQGLESEHIFSRLSPTPASGPVPRCKCFTDFPALIHKQPQVASRC